jgi:hypothetical protein
MKTGWHILAAALFMLAGIIFAVYGLDVIGLILINLGAILSIAYTTATPQGGDNE